MNYNEILELSIKNEYHLKHYHLLELDDFLQEARDNGWYPFVTEIIKGNYSYEYIYFIEKNEIIFDLLMFEKEYFILEDFVSADLEYYKERIKYFKDLYGFK